jgi:hypothetical protein
MVKMQREKALLSQAKVQGKHWPHALDAFE